MASEMIERVALALMKSRYRSGKPAHLNEKQSQGGILLPISIQQANWEECERDARVAVAEVEASVKSLLKGEFSTAHLTLNEYKSSYYESVQDAIDHREHGLDNWVSDDERAKATETGDIWQIQWYPDTPVGFYVVSGSSLLSVVNEALKE